MLVTTSTTALECGITIASACPHGQGRRELSLHGPQAKFRAGTPLKPSHSIGPEVKEDRFWKDMILGIEEGVKSLYRRWGRQNHSHRGWETVLTGTSRRISKLCPSPS